MKKNLVVLGTVLSMSFATQVFAEAVTISRSGGAPGAHLIRLNLSKFQSSKTEAVELKKAAELDDTVSVSRSGGSLSALEIKVNK